MIEEWMLGHISGEGVGRGGGVLKLLGFEHRPLGDLNQTIGGLNPYGYATEPTGLCDLTKITWELNPDHRLNSEHGLKPDNWGIETRPL